jgi:hypothetical protein
MARNSLTVNSVLRFSRFSPNGTEAKVFGDLDFEVGDGLMWLILGAEELRKALMHGSVP